MSNYKSYFLKSLGLREDSLPGGKGDETEPTQVDPEQLKMGIAVEMEHTQEPDLAREIAMDHIAEDPQYYSHLKDAGMADELDSGQSAPNIPMMQKLFSPTAIMPTPVIAVGVRGTRTGLLPAGGIVDDPEKARLGGLELVKNLKPNSQGAISDTPASAAIKASGGHYTPDNKEISSGKSPVTNVKGDDSIHPMQVQQLGNKPFEDDGTTRDGEHTPASAGGTGDSPKTDAPTPEPKKGPWGIEVDDTEEEDEEGEVSVDIKETLKEAKKKICVHCKKPRPCACDKKDDEDMEASDPESPKFDWIRFGGSGGRPADYKENVDIKETLKDARKEIKEGWAMGEYAPKQQAAIDYLRARGYGVIATYSDQPDAEGGNTTHEVIAVLRKRKGATSVQCEVDPNGLCNGKPVKAFLDGQMEECGTMRERFQTLANIKECDKVPPLAGDSEVKEAGALSELRELVGRLNAKGSVTPLLAKLKNISKG